MAAPGPGGLTADHLLVDDGARVVTRGLALVPFLGSALNSVRRYLGRLDLPVFLRRPGQLTADMIERGRRSYLVSLIIQSRGQYAPFACRKCARSNGMFWGCRILPGVAGGACANCNFSTPAKQCWHSRHYEGLPPTEEDRAVPARDPNEPAWEAEHGSIDDEDYETNDDNYDGDVDDDYDNEDEDDVEEEDGNYDLDDDQDTP